MQLHSSNDVEIRFLQTQWTDDDFWKSVASMVERLSAECPTASREEIERAVIRDWLVLSEPIGRG